MQTTIQPDLAEAIATKVARMTVGELDFAIADLQESLAIWVCKAAATEYCHKLFTEYRLATARRHKLWLDQSASAFPGIDPSASL
jgi:hypothetical protein